MKDQCGNGFGKKSFVKKTTTRSQKAHNWWKGEEGGMSNSSDGVSDGTRWEMRRASCREQSDWNRESMGGAVKDEVRKQRGRPRGLRR